MKMQVCCETGRHLDAKRKLEKGEGEEVVVDNILVL